MSNTNRKYKEQMVSYSQLYEVHERERVAVLQRVDEVPANLSQTYLRHLFRGLSTLHWINWIY